jgi:acyl-CoA thioesterase-2
MLERRPTEADRGGLGSWIRLDADVGDDPIDHVCGLAFMSDAAPSRAARAPHPDYDSSRGGRGQFQGASLDHSMWFHRSSRPDEWHWFAAQPHALFGGRGLMTGDVISADGTEVATIAQQVLLRRLRPNR